MPRVPPSCMTTIKLANLAREAFSADLFKRGVHGLSVEKVTLAGKATFAVVAMVQPGSKATFPQALEVVDKDKQASVPLIVRATPPFQPE